MAEPERYTKDYYANNEQDGDRIALWYYERLTRRLAKAGSQVLDYGAGTGWFARRLSRHFITDAFEPSVHAQEAIVSNAPGVGLKTRTSDIAAGSYDLVVSLHVLEHLSQPSEAISDIHRILRPGGRALCVVPNPNGWGHRIKGDAWFAYTDPTHVALLSREEWVLAFEEVSLSVDRLGTDGLWDFPYTRKVPKAVEMCSLGAGAGLQVLLGRAFLPPDWGECLLIFASKQ
jgi:SAM-dependent methyltransferase